MIYVKISYGPIPSQYIDYKVKDMKINVRHFKSLTKQEKSWWYYYMII